MINSSSATAAAYTPSWLVDKVKKKAAAAPSHVAHSITSATTTISSNNNTSAPVVAAGLTRQPDGTSSPIPASQPAYHNSNGSTTSSSFISVTRTSNNLTSAMVHRPPLSSSAISTSLNGSSAVLPGAAIQHSPVLIGRSPTIHKRVPIRMSPMIVPSKHHMNPQAAAFVPGRDILSSGLDVAGSVAAAAASAASIGTCGAESQHALEALPSSTADMEAKELVQLQMIDHSSNNNNNASCAIADAHVVQQSPTAQETAPGASETSCVARSGGAPVDSDRFAAMSSKNTKHDNHYHRVVATPKLETHPRSVHITPALKPILLEHKSALEILEISKRSALSVAAPAYVSKRTMSRLMLEKPSPLLLGAASGDAAEENVDLMLEDLWCLYYMPLNLGKSVKNEDFNPLLVFRIDSIPTLWKVFNNIPTPTELQPSTLYLFRDGIDPKWEDAANCDGGILKIKVGSNEIDEAWELLLCRTIGDSWSPNVRNTVNGVALKIREHACLLEIWVTRQTPELLKDIAELLQPLLGATFVTVYYTHLMIQERAKAATAMSEKQKKQQQRRRY